jgi:hypothetical protein
MGAEYGLLPQPVGAQVKQAKLFCGETNLVLSKKQPDIENIFIFFFFVKGFLCGGRDVPRASSYFRRRVPHRRAVCLLY